MGKRFNRKKRRFLDDKAENDRLDEDKTEYEEEDTDGAEDDEAASDEENGGTGYKKAVASLEDSEAGIGEEDEIETDEGNDDAEDGEERTDDEDDGTGDGEAEGEDDVIEAGGENDEAEDDEADGEAEAEAVEADETNGEPEGDAADAEEADNEIEDGEEVSLDESASEKVDRRVFRRKRRVRNQIIAYGVMTLCLAALITAGVFAGLRISDVIKEKKQQKELAAQLEQQLAELEEQQQEEKPADLIIETPPADIIEEPTREEQLDEIVNKCISEMPLEDKVASLFIITPEALTGVRTVIKAGDTTQEALSKYAVGGLIYFSQNIVSREQLTEMLSKTVLSSKYPIFLAVDEEGGAVSRVADSSIDVVKVDDMAVIGTSGDALAAHEAGNTIGTYLKELGFNLDFAPVADVVTDAEGSVLGSRSFGTDAAVAADMVSNVVEGMQGAGVNACLKHFPGLGSAEDDTHDGRVEITKTLEEMENSDFLPFRAGIEAGAKVIMVSHVTASAIDEEGLPSSLSKVIITDVLRGNLGFEGVVVTDALNMSAVSEYYTSEEAAVMAVRAGADMLLMPEDFEAAYNGLLTAVQEGTISEERIDESLRRIYRIKYADKLE